MAFITIPVLLILISIIGIAIIIWRKVPYLKKLSVTDRSGDLNGEYQFSWILFLEDLFPELKDLMLKLRWKEYKDTWLSELEKVVRRLRLVSLRLDRLSERLIKKIRQLNKKSNLAVSSPEPVKPSPAVPMEVGPRVEVQKSLEQLKIQEQNIIIEIAKNPKDFKLYEMLGDLYIEMKNWADAKESFEAAKELNPSRTDITEKLELVGKHLQKSEVIAGTQGAN